jgi:hypothetical protein
MCTEFELKQICKSKQNKHRTKMGNQNKHRTKTRIKQTPDEITVEKTQMKKNKKQSRGVIPDQNN